MLLKECINDVDFDEALIYCRRIPAFLGAKNNIYFQKTNRFPEVKWRSFWIEVQNDEKIYFCARLYTFPNVTPALSIYCDERLTVERKSLYQTLDEIRLKVPEFFTFDAGIVMTFEPILSEYCSWYADRFPSNELKHYPTFTYYMTEEQKAELVKDSQDPISLPEGYQFAEADIENDSKVITETWAHASLGEVECTKRKLKHFPSSLIKEKSSGKLVAWEMIELGGAMNHLFTLSEHRHKGLGGAVEKDLSLKLIRENLTPYKFVEEYNKEVIASSDKSKFWTLWKFNGIPAKLLFLKHVLKLK